MRLIILSLLLHTVFSQRECSSFTNENECVTLSDDACGWYQDECRCISPVKLDIICSDTSGSITVDGFQNQKEFIKKLAHEINYNSLRIGFYMFATEVNHSRGINTSWDTPQELDHYIDGLYLTGGWTNTGQLLADALDEFNNTKQNDRQQLLILITDGYPCMPESSGGCPQSVCEIAPDIKIQGVRTIIIAVGSGISPTYIDCLCQNKDEDYIPVASFNQQNFDSIMGSLSGELCCVSINAKVTEVKAMRRPLTWTENGDGRFTRFIEIYNKGIGFNLQELRLEGLVIMDAGPDVMVTQGQFVVFYDASDAPVSADSSIGPGPSIPSCHDCGNGCGRDNCPDTAGYCFCDNSVYIACGNTNDTTCPNPGNGALIDQINPSLNSTDGCNICRFNNNVVRIFAIL